VQSVHHSFGQTRDVRTTELSQEKCINSRVSQAEYMKLGHGVPRMYQLAGLCSNMDWQKGGFTSEG